MAWCWSKFSSPQSKNQSGGVYCKYSSDKDPSSLSIEANEKRKLAMDANMESVSAVNYVHGCSGGTVRKKLSCMWLRVLVLLSVFVLGNSHCVGNISQSEYSAMESLYDSTNGYNWTYKYSK